jgi:two-component system response regulator AtoC
MPGMNGVDLAHEVQRGWPDLPIILMSGDESPVTLAAHGLSDVPFLQKPFDQEELLEVVSAAFKPPQLTGC